MPQPGHAHAELLGRPIADHEIVGNLVPDAMLSALALEHGLTLYSADTDFARFEPSGLRWRNPLA